MRRVTLITAGLVLAIAAPASGAGGPVPPAQGGAGVSTPGGSDNFIAVSGGPDRTVVMRVRRDDGSVVRSRSVTGSYGIPGVTFDGIDTGLSADGGTLVLATGATRYPVKRTSLLVLNTRSMRTTQRISLPGLVTVDALSPDGRWMYLVDYKGGNAASYDVRAYDLREHRLLAKPVVDPREPDDKLQGFPVTRVSSPDGRWAYTLYSGPKTFIHALDTARRTAVCIDLPSIGDSSATRLQLTGAGLSVLDNGVPAQVVDLKTFKVSAAAPAPAAAAPKPKPTPRPAAATGDGGGPPWALWLVAVVGLVVLVSATRRRAGARLRATRDM